MQWRSKCAPIFWSLFFFEFHIHFLLFFCSLPLETKFSCKEKRKKVFQFVKNTFNSKVQQCFHVRETGKGVPICQKYILDSIRKCNKVLRKTYDKPKSLLRIVQKKLWNLSYYSIEFLLLLNIYTSACSRDSRPRDWSCLGSIFMVSVSPNTSRDSREWGQFFKLNILLNGLS